MKQLFASVLFLTSFYNFAWADEAALLKRIEVLENRVDELESGLKFFAPFAMGKGALKPGEPITPPQNSTTPTSEKTDLANEPPALPVHIDKIKAGTKDDIGRQTVDLQISMSNNSGRDMDIITASIVISDVAGNTLMNVKWQNNKGIAAGKSITMSGSYSGSLNSNGIETALATDPALLRAKVDLYKIAFKGGDVVKYKDCGWNCN